jgi:hypothetical protein
MAADSSSDIRFEIGHVLFIDIVGYSKLLINDYATDAVAKPNAEAVLAQIQARFGDFDSAIAAIPHLLEVPAGITAADLRLNPWWDLLRKDPRFPK